MQIDESVKITAVEIWNPTMMLRWKMLYFTKVLQQKWVSNLGKEEWRNVPEETESDDRTMEEIEKLPY